MTVGLVHTHHMHPANDMPQEAGVYTWHVPTNILFADRAVALLFGMDPADTVKGKPLEAYLARVHPDDLPDLAKSIHDTIAYGEVFQMTYRVFGRNGIANRIAAFGRCFRDDLGQPSHYSGVICTAEIKPAAPPSLSCQCLAALDAARREGNVAAAEKLLDLMRDLEWSQLGSSPPLRC